MAEVRLLMNDVLTELLVRLRTDNGLVLAAVCADGLMVAADAADGMDPEGICATAGDGFLMMTALGAELSAGEATMLTIEYEHGTVVVNPLGFGAALVMMTGSAVNLGRLRLAARRFQEQSMNAAAPVGV
jgi:predicted regulator of Ras-like GTPase activity (Roadblock/LC7/MglB family)